MLSPRILRPVEWKCPRMNVRVAVELRVLAAPQVRPLQFDRLSAPCRQAPRSFWSLSHVLFVSLTGYDFGHTKDSPLIQNHLCGMN